MGRANYCVFVFVKHLRVDLCSAHVAMAEQFLYRTNVVTCLDHVGCEAVAKTVAGYPVVDARLAGC